MRPPVYKARSKALPLSLDLETAPDEPARPVGIRAYVGGVLYVEGLVVFFMGATLLATYWPPIKAHGEPANPVSQLGLWLCAGALLYMVVVGLFIFFYNLLRPSNVMQKPEPNASGAVSRARRYASMKKRTRYIIDNTIRCEADADDAIHARDLY